MPTRAQARPLADSSFVDTSRKKSRNSGLNPRWAAILRTLRLVSNNWTVPISACNNSIVAPSISSSPSARPDVRQRCRPNSLSRDNAADVFRRMRSVSISADPSEKLPSTERLDEIIVRPGFDSLDAGLLAGPGREHDHRRVAELRILSHSFEQSKPVERGIITSVTITSGLCRRAASSAASPSPTASTSYCRAQQPPQVVAQILVVVGQEHPARGGLRIQRRGLTVENGADFRRARLRGTLLPGNPVQRLFDIGGRAEGR